MVQAEVPRSARSSIAGGFVLVSVASLMACWRACRSAPLGHRRLPGLARLPRAPGATVPGRGGPCGGLLGRRAGQAPRRLGEAGQGLRRPPRRRRPPGVGRRGYRLPDARPRGARARGLHRQGPGARRRPPEDPPAPGRQRRPALIAAVLGILLRCLSRRKEGFDGRGRVKASWIARVFGLDLRRVKAARRELVNLGWIGPEPSGRSAENQWGRLPDRPGVGPGPRRWSLFATPPPADRPADCHPFCNQEPLREEAQHQEPRRGPSGFSIQGSGEGDKKLPSPTLAEVRIEDLKDTVRLLELHRQAIGRELIGGSEAERLKFVGAAEHALAIGRGNPLGCSRTLSVEVAGVT